MTLSTITPYVTLCGLMITVLALADHLCKDAIKQRVTDKIVRLAQIGTRPLTLSFYGLAVLSSILLTVLIIAINGNLQSLEDQRGSLQLAVKSAGPLFLAVILKILVVDYALALKSFFLWNSIRASIFESPTRKKSIKMIGGIIVFALDAWFSSALIAAFMNWSEMFQAKHATIAISEPNSMAKTLSDFFDSIHFIVQDSIRHAFYILNGCLIFYVSLAISTVAKSAANVIEGEKLKGHIFLTIGVIVAVTVFIIVVCYQVAWEN